MNKHLIDLYREDVAEIKALVTAAKTYGDFWKIRDDIKDTRRFANRQIKELRTGIARYERNLRRRPDFDFYQRWLERDRRTLAALVAIRDELTEGLRYFEADNRRRERETARIIDEFNAEVCAECGAKRSDHKYIGSHGFNV